MDHVENYKVTKEEKVIIADDKAFTTNELEFLGVKQTADKGTDPNKVETGCISNRIAKTVDGVGSIPDSSMTVNDDVTKDGSLDQAMKLKGQTKWVKETLDHGVGAVGVIFQARFTNVKITGQQLNNLQEFVINYDLVSDDYYYIDSEGVEHPLSAPSTII